MLPDTEKVTIYLSFGLFELRKLRLVSWLSMATGLSTWILNWSRMWLSSSRLSDIKFPEKHTTRSPLQGKLSHLSNFYLFLKDHVYGYLFNQHFCCGCLFFFNKVVIFLIIITFYDLKNVCYTGFLKQMYMLISMQNI